MDNASSAGEIDESDVQNHCPLAAAIEPFSESHDFLPIIDGSSNHCPANGVRLGLRLYGRGLACGGRGTSCGHNQRRGCHINPDITRHPACTEEIDRSGRV